MQTILLMTSHSLQPHANPLPLLSHLRRTANLYSANSFATTAPWTAGEGWTANTCCMGLKLYNRAGEGFSLSPSASSFFYRREFMSKSFLNAIEDLVSRPLVHRLRASRVFVHHESSCIMSPRASWALCVITRLVNSRSCQNHTRRISLDILLRWRKP